MVITTIVFDMGGVLVDFDAKRSLSTHFDEKYHSLINEKTFASETWKLMDKGTYSVDEAIRIMCRELPTEIHSEVRKMILDHEGEMPPIEAMYDIVKTLTVPIGLTSSKKAYPPLSFSTDLLFQHGIILLSRVKKFSECCLTNSHSVPKNAFLLTTPLPI